MKRFSKYGWTYMSGILIYVILISSISVKNVTTADPVIQSNSAQAVNHTIWGSSAGPFPGEQIADKDAWIRLNEKIKSLNGGYGLEGRRSYDRAIPANFAASAMAADVGNCKVSFNSFKPNWIQTANGSNNEAMKKYIQSIPDDRIVYLIFHHEPEDDLTAQNTADVLQRAFARFVDIVLTSGKPNVHPCFNLMTWTFKPQSGRDPETFNMSKYLKPEQLKEVIAGLDGYAADPAVSAQECFEPYFAKMATWGFTRFAIFETGAHASATPTARSAWVKGLGQWVNTRKDMECVAWFGNGNGQHAGPAGWFLGTWKKDGDSYIWEDGDGTLSAYAQLLKPNKK